MDRVYESGAAVSEPGAPATPSSGFPTKGNPAGGVPATLPGEYWYHMITESLVKVIEAAGLTPDHTDLTQLLTALQAGFGLSQSAGVNGHQTLAGGLILQHGSPNLSANPSTVIFPTAFTTAVYAVVSTEIGSDNGGHIVTNTTLTGFDANNRNGNPSFVFPYIAVGR